MMRYSNKFAEEITNETHLDNIKEDVSKDFKDPSSAVLRNVVLKTHAEGDKIICGAVNAKNSYGAYSGFTTFMSLGIWDKENYSSTLFTMDDNNTDTVIYWMCALTFPKKQ